MMMMMMMTAWPHCFLHSCLREGGRESVSERRSARERERETLREVERGAGQWSTARARGETSRRAVTRSFNRWLLPRMFRAPGSVPRYTSQSPRLTHGHWSPNAHPVRRHGRVLVAAGSAGVLGVPGAPGHYGQGAAVPAHLLPPLPGKHR